MYVKIRKQKTLYLKNCQEDIFYFFKGEAMEQISDDELIEFMKRDFDGKCQGSIEYLSGTSLEELCRGTRYGLNGLE